MPMTLDSALATHLAQDTTTLAFLFKLTYTHPVNGPTSIGFTTAGVDLTFSGVSYPADNGVTHSTFTSQIGLTADKFDLSGPLTAGGITEANIHAGIYDFADVDVYLCNWASPTTPPATWGKYKVGEISLSGREWIMECSEITDQFRLSIVELTSPSCRVDLFSTRCKVPATVPVWTPSTFYSLSSPYEAEQGSWVRPSVQNRFIYRCTVDGTSQASEPTWNLVNGGLTVETNVTWTARNPYVLTGSVTAKTSNQVFADSTITEANNYWQFGKIVWLTGANAGYSMEIKSQTATVIELYFPMINAIAVGDTFNIYTGCDKSRQTCNDKFLNIWNMQAEPNKPSRKIMSKLGKA